MLESLLVPLDGSKFSETSLSLAGHVARSTGARLHLAHVHVAYEPDQLLASTPFQYEGVNMAEYDARHLEQEQEYLAGLSKRISQDGTCVDAKVLEGPQIAESLATYAGQVDADLVVITSHGHSGVSRIWLGSVADEMIRHTTLPLLVSRPGAEGGADILTVRHILVPLDGSELAERVLDPAADLARATGARITLAHVVSMQTALGPRILPLLVDTLEPELDGAVAYLEETAGALREDGLDVSTRAAHGKAPALAIARMAKEVNADVIAMATHGYGGLKRALLGSVADKILRVSELPLLIMRPSAA